MGALTTLATVATIGKILAPLAVTAVGAKAVHSMVESDISRRDNERRTRELQDDQEKQLKLQEEQFTKNQAIADEERTEQNRLRESATANANRDLAKTRQRRLATQGQSYRDTILTSPLGIPSSEAAPTVRKTLLGG